LRSATRIMQGRVAFGGYADIYRGRWEHGGSPREVAIKSLQVQKNTKQKLIKRLYRELRLWHSLNHENILPLLGIFTGLGDVPALVSPWCQKGDICSYIAPRVDFNVYHALRFSLLEQVLLGLEYLHGHDPAIIHCDLKGPNILMSDDGKPLLSDFGSALRDIKNNSDTSTVHGTLRWMSPELNDPDCPQPHSTHSDMWAFACVAVELYTGGAPPYVQFKNDGQVILAVAQGTLPKCPPRMPNDLWSILRRCFASEPTDRPSVTDLLASIKDFTIQRGWIPRQARDNDLGAREKETCGQPSNQ